MEIGNALRELARQDPYAAPGYLWKNPFNPRSTGRRWTPRTLEFFQRWQIYERQNLDELAAQGGASAAGAAAVGPKEVGELVAVGRATLGEEEDVGGVMPVRAVTLVKNSRKSGPLPCSACISLLRRSLESMTRW
jgi:hypothetical protein